MDFFEHQHQAKRRSFMLIFFYLIGIAFLVGVLAVAASYLYALLVHLEQGVPLQNQFQGDRVVLEFQRMLRPISEMVLIFVVPFILLVTLISYFNFSRGGGAKVARSMGGRLLQREDAKTLEDQQLLNVVEEIGIASRLGHIPVYVIEGDRSINAFAAGTKQENMVIGITRGAIDHLDRDELQGVIAHEMGHVFNNDMRMNVQVSALIHGLMVLVLAGYMLWPRRMTANKFALVTMISAILLIIVGYIGKLAGMIVQAAVSREREYLADATAVQYTRNNQGIASALEKIKKHNSKFVPNVNGEVEANSHFFFVRPKVMGLSNMLTGLLSTHPPLEKRIARLRPSPEEKPD